MGSFFAHPNEVYFDTDEKRLAYTNEFFKRSLCEKIVMWKDYKFPVENPVDVIADDGVKLATYFWPASSEVEFQGVIFF